MFGEIEKAEIIGCCSDFLSGRGITVQQVENFSEVESIIEQAGKEYLTPVVSPSHNDLTQGNCIWLVGWQDGEPAVVGGARLEDLRGETVESFWPRSLGRMYGRTPDEIVESVSRELSLKLSGKLVYFGDLHVMKGGRGALSTLRAFTLIGHLAVSLKWDPDVTYAFVREGDVMRGAAARYGFSELRPAPLVWKNPPHPRTNSEWCGMLPRASLAEVARATRTWIGDHSVQKVTQIIREA